MSHIAFNRASIAGNEIAYIQQALDGMHISGDGPFTKKCNGLIEQALGIPHALITTSCTHALEMAAMLLDLMPGDEVIVPSFTFVTTVNAFVLRGARPVFVDIRPDTLNMDEAQLNRLITSRTRAIVPVHYAGVGCEMNAILEIAGHHNLVVVEDNAHGLFGKYRGKYLGTMGAMATQSFHETKNFTCGEGGALLINDVRYAARAEVLREKGTNRSRFFRGEVDKYSWVDIGSSYLPSDILAAFLFAQLEAREAIQHRRRKIWEFYRHELQSWANENEVRLPIIPTHCEHPYHMFYMLFPNLEKRQAFLAHLKVRQIHAVFHYVPLHLSEMGQRFGSKPGDCPITEAISDRLVRLPFFNDLSSADQQFVVESVRAFNC